MAVWTLLQIFLEGFVLNAIADYIPKVCIFSKNKLFHGYLFVYGPLELMAAIFLIGFIKSIDTLTTDH